MSEHKVKYIDQKSAVEFLATTIKEMKDAGLMVAVKNVAAKPDRPAGIIVYIGEVALQGGSLTYAVAIEKTAETGGGNVRQDGRKPTLG